MKFEPLGITGYETISLDLNNPISKKLPEPFRYINKEDIEEILEMLKGEEFGT